MRLREVDVGKSKQVKLGTAGFRVLSFLFPYFRHSENGASKFIALGLRQTILLRLVIVAGAGMLVGAAAHQILASPASEYEVKAAYLYNFGRFVEWPQNIPSGQTNEFTICVLGRDPFGLALDATISGEKIDGKNVVARRISKVGEAAACRVLFISSSENKQLREILSTIGKLSVLTVSDMPQFVQQGGMVQFVLVENRVRFEINLEVTRQAGLNLSSELLKVATEVRGKSRPGG